MVFYNFVLRWTKIGVVCYISCLVGCILANLWLRVVVLFGDCWW